MNLVRMGKHQILFHECAFAFQLGNIYKKMSSLLLEEAEQLAKAKVSSMAEFVESGEARVWASMDENNLAGFVWAFVNKKDGFVDRIHVNHLSVDELYRNQGIAQQLMNQVFAWAKEEHIVQVELHVQQTNEAAKALYSKLGFTVETLTMVRG